jgi:hypothetical protein
MDLNTICIGLLILPILYGFYIYYTQPGVPSMPKALWGEQVGRSKHIQSKTGDASLFTQGTRRTATKNGGFQRGFMSAAIDYFFISRICPVTNIPIVICPCKRCDVMDGGNGAARLLDDFLDGGGAGTNFSDCNMDGGAVISGKTCSITEGGNGAARIVQDIVDGGKARANFVEFTTDGGGTIQDEFNSADAGEGAARIFQDVLDGGGAN